MKTLNLLFISILFLFNYFSYGQIVGKSLVNYSNDIIYLNNFKVSNFEIGPVEQRIFLSIGSNAIFKIGDLDGSPSIRLEYKPFANGNYITFPGYNSISSTGVYQISTIELQTILGIGIFVWRAVDNSNPNHFSSNNLLIVLL